MCTSPSVLAVCPFIHHMSGPPHARSYIRRVHSRLYVRASHIWNVIAIGIICRGRYTAQLITCASARIATEAFGDEAAEKNIFRQAVQNGTVRSLTHMCNAVCSRSIQHRTCMTQHFGCIRIVVTCHTVCYSCMIPLRRELHLKYVWAMTDKQLDIMLKRVRSYKSCHRYVYTTHQPRVVTVACARITSH